MRHFPNIYGQRNVKMAEQALYILVAMVTKQAKCALLLFLIHICYLSGTLKESLYQF